MQFEGERHLRFFSVTLLSNETNLINYMKKNYLLIAVAMVAALSMVSCKNNKKSAQSQEPTQEEVQEMKQALADSVLTKIDELAEQYWDSYSKSFRLRTLELTDAEKLVKPDYLLDPSVANNLVTRSQKINALAIYDTEHEIRKIYDMPCDDVEEVIAKLIVDLNFPLSVDTLFSDAPVSEKIRAYYNACKERGDLALFWQFEYAIVTEGMYILSQNPELFLSKITDEQWQAWRVVKQTRVAAIEELAKYDEEMAQLWEFRNKNRVTASDEERDRKDQSIETAKQYYIANKDKYAAKRNALLQ